MEKINSETVIYNGLNIRQILERLPKKLRKFKIHRNLYIQNCIEVYNCEKSKMNLNYANCIRNSNFILLKMYFEY